MAMQPMQQMAPAAFAMMPAEAYASMQQGMHPEIMQVGWRSAPTQG